MDVEEDFKKNVPVMCVLQVWDAVQYLLVNDMVVCLICQGNRGFCICSIQRDVIVHAEIHFYAMENVTRNLLSLVKAIAGVQIAVKNMDIVNI
jgi:hypothetical protein